LPTDIFILDAISSKVLVAGSWLLVAGFRMMNEIPAPKALSLTPNA